MNGDQWLDYEEAREYGVKAGFKQGFQAGYEKGKSSKAALDKIRAEILQVANQEKGHDEKWALGLRYAVKIIDKYKAESEDRG